MYLVVRDVLGGIASGDFRRSLTYCNKIFPSSLFTLFAPSSKGLTIYLFLFLIRIMMFMQKEYRLINDFKKQTKTTIWKHLDAMAVNYAVYSSHLNGLPPFLTGFDLYVYCDNLSLVVLCLDYGNHGDEQAYEESETLSSLILTDNHEPRVSIVWKLAQAVRMISMQLAIPVHGVLLMEADIQNAYELYEMWDANNISVIDTVKRLKSKKIQVNGDWELTCKSYVDALREGELPEEHNDDNDCTDCDGPFNEMEEDTPEDETTADDDNIFPDGKIEQNGNVSIKVDILKPIANPREELDKLAGCADIKKRMDELVALTSYNKMMREMFPNSRQHEVSLHSLFLGRPGTGKTTVCKIYGSLLRQAGALSKGHVVVCDRGTFIGTLWGDEERSMRQVLEIARGGVLMIDEAYLLSSGSANDPGKIVIQLLMNVLADETQRDLAVVLCGYKAPMLKLLELNPGLQSRFPNKFEFADFTVDELLAITQLRIKDYEYHFTPEAWKKYSTMLTQSYQQRDPETWGNARFVANQLERIYIEHASRCIHQELKDKVALRMITADDIVPIEVPRQKAKIGF